MADDTNFYPEPETAETETPETESDADETETPQSDESEDKDDQAEGETALLPKSMFGGEPPKPGDKCTFTVKHVYSDEIEVEYGKEEGGEDEGKPAGSMSDVEGMMDTMAEGKE